MQGMQQPQLCLVGGYADPKGHGQALVGALLAACTSLNPQPLLQLNLTQQLNTADGGRPLCTSLALDVTSGQVQSGITARRQLTES